MIYHLLPGKESFSSSAGLALAHDVANMMQYDPSAVVVCRASDGSWGFPAERHLIIPAMRIFGRIKGRKYIPRFITTPFFRHIFRPLIERLQSGDILWCHNQPFFCAALAKAARAKGARIVYHAHNPVTDRPTRAAFRVFKPEASVFVSNAIRLCALEWMPWLTDTYVVPNGADTAEFYPATPAERPQNAAPQILFVGRLVPIKGVHVLLEAMRLLQQQGVEAHCRIVGSAFLKGTKPTSYVRRLLRDPPSNVEFAGFCAHTEVANQYRRSDIVCCPSVWQEPFGNVNIEAMACAVPVVATRVGGIPEIAADGGILLVDPNSATALAEALKQLITSSDMRARVAGEGFRSFQRRYTWAAVCVEYGQIASSLGQRQAEEVAC